MNHADVKRAVRRAAALWEPILGLDRWTLYYHWQEVPDNDDVPAGFHAVPEYHHAVIYFNLPLITGRERATYPTAKHIEYLVLHELCHGLSWIIVEQAEPYARTEPFRVANESATTATARALWVARYHEEPPAKRP